jgi:hypothetical protein
MFMVSSPVIELLKSDATLSEKSNYVVITTAFAQNASEGSSEETIPVRQGEFFVADGVVSVDASAVNDFVNGETIAAAFNLAAICD